MAVRKVRIWPDPALNEVALPVETVDDEVRALVNDLFETMYKANGVGLAATQVAVPRRVLVIDLDPHGDAKNDAEMAADLADCGFSGPEAFINPEIVESEGEVSWDEGCLSLPGITEPIQRWERIQVRALDPDGNELITNVTGLFAVALQHEMDHLDGKVFVDYLSKLKRDVIKRKMERLKAEETDDGVIAAAQQEIKG